MEKKGWGPIKYTTFPDEMDPYKGHYAEYDKERASADDVPFKTWEQGAFRNVDRIKLIASIIEAPVADKGCGMKIKDLTVGGLAKRSLNSTTPPLGRKMLPLKQRPSLLRRNLRSLLKPLLRRNLKKRLPRFVPCRPASGSSLSHTSKPLKLVRLTSQKNTSL